MKLPPHVLELLNRSDTIKILGVCDNDENLDLVPLAIVKAPKFDLILLPQSAGKRTQNYLTNAMKLAQPVSILCFEHLRYEEPAYQITCAVREYQTTGPLYEKFIDELRVSYEGLQGVWVLGPLSVRESHPEAILS